MGGRKSKSKGSAFEREICRTLSVWVSNGQDEDLFWRSAMSGGRATVQRRKGNLNRQAGDICAVASEGHVLTDLYYFECKHYKNLRVHLFLLENAGPLWDMWNDACINARKHGRRPVLIARDHKMPTIVITRSSMALASPKVPRLITRFNQAYVCLLTDMLKYPPEFGAAPK